MKWDLKRMGSNLLILSLIYFNIAALVSVCHIRFQRSSFRSRFTRGPLPNHWVPEHLFKMFGLFSGATWTAKGFSAYGVDKRFGYTPQKPQDSMIDLNIYQFYPQTLGEAHRRILLHSFSTHKKRRDREYTRMANILQRKHNDLNPDQKVEQVFIYLHWWGKSKKGYKDNYEKRKTRLLGSN